jgi:hypothetical protein
MSALPGCWLPEHQFPVPIQSQSLIKWTRSSQSCNHIIFSPLPNLFQPNRIEARRVVLLQFSRYSGRIKGQYVSQSSAIFLWKEIPSIKHSLCSRCTAFLRDVLCCCRARLSLRRSGRIFWVQVPLYVVSQKPNIKKFKITTFSFGFMDVGMKRFLSLEERNIQNVALHFG